MAEPGGINAGSTNRGGLAAGCALPLLRLLLSLRWELVDLRALRLAAMAVRVRVLLPGSPVATPTLAGVEFFGHVPLLSSDVQAVIPAAGRGKRTASGIRRITLERLVCPA